MAGGRGGRSGTRGGLPREVRISKKLSWLLRHGAVSERLQLDERGFATVEDVLNNRNLRSLGVNFEELQSIVRNNDKQRFTMAPASSVTTSSRAPIDGQEAAGLSMDPRDWIIRANQGHSIRIESEGLLQPIIAENMPETVVHGTTHSAWPLIVASGGLKPMGRNHVHFASGLPAVFKSIADPRTDRDTDSASIVISGMRTSSTVLVFLDLAKAMEAGIKFWLSDNGVILSEGDKDGIVPLAFFMRVEDRTGQGVLVEHGKVIKEAPPSWTAKATWGKQ